METTRDGARAGDLRARRLADRGERLVERGSRDLDADAPHDTLVDHEAAAAEHGERLEGVGEVHVPQAQGERAPARVLRGGGAALDDDAPGRVPVDPAGRGVLVERVVHRHGQLGVGPRHRALAAGLEAMAGALLRHEELRDAEEAPLQPALEGAHRPLADR